ncbi:hypothetical protein JDV02_005813 [Purpureocillium takamizusanense]|uniref:Uncharacterized protein n=1 Tax=Purpureocillium takamizusanense TaxID=2060973 RepID=A0A9Q8VBG4_9HYPO|nr:uncharacterized protein JDV02_005813 [Purpureocillium takamizusanense]UNI19638.1 hypothetical protein JDV02_005813 [Purpureocillium takamizusanense]
MKASLSTLTLALAFTLGSAQDSSEKPSNELWEMSTQQAWANFKDSSGRNEYKFCKKSEATSHAEGLLVCNAQDVDVAPDKTTTPLGDGWVRLEEACKGRADGCHLCYKTSVKKQWESLPTRFFCYEKAESTRNATLQLLEFLKESGLSKDETRELVHSCDAKASCGDEPKPKAKDQEVDMKHFETMRDCAVKYRVNFPTQN